MRIGIERSVIRGFIRAPQSKSYAIRLIFSSLITSVSLYNLTYSDDVRAAIRAVEAFGVVHEGGTFRRSELKIVRSYVNVGGSATVLRFLIPIVSVVGSRITIDGDETLRKRPIGAIIEALMDKGIRIHGRNLPITIEGVLRDRYIEIRGDESSQYISGFMYAFAASGGGTIVIKPPVSSKSYIYLTADILRSLGVDVRIGMNKIDVEVGDKLLPYAGEVPGDYLLSSFYVASALLTGGEISVYGLPNPYNFFGDHSIVNIYRSMGAISIYSNNIWYARASDSYKPISIDVDDAPDLAPSIAPLASVASGRSVIMGVRRLRIKESDRILTISSSLRSFGIAVETSDNAIEIYGGEPRRGYIRCPNDHRIAMMVTPIALRAGGVVDNAECVNKSNPGFWRDIESLGGRIVYSQA